MTKQDDLFDLIKSLNKTEKHYFKLQANIRGGDQEYLYLFEVIDKLTYYDEDKIKQACSSFQFTKHLAKAKNHLFNAIVTGIDDYAQLSAFEHKLNQQIKTIDFLQAKGLILTCVKYIIKAKELAQKLEDFQILLKLNHLEYKLAAKLDNKTGKEVKEINQENNNLIIKFTNLLTYEQLYRTAYELLHLNPKCDTDQINNLFNTPCLQNISQAFSYKAKSQFLHIWALRHTFHAQYSDQYKTEYEILKNFENQYGNEIMEIPLGYAIRIHHFLIVSINIKKPEHFNHYLFQLKQLLELKINDSDKLRIEEYYHYHQLAYLFVTANHANAITVADEIDKSDFIGNNNVRKKIREAITCRLFTIFFSLGDYKRALKYLNILLTNPKKEIKHLNYLCRIYEIMLHYELKNIQMLMSRTEAARSYFKRSGIENKLENTMLQALSKLVYATDKIEEQNVFAKLKKELNAQVKIPSEKIKLEYFNFQLWIESKLTNVSLAEIIKMAS